VLLAREHLALLPMPLADEASQLLTTAVERLSLSARGRARTARVARTIAALAGDQVVDAQHVGEALSYRPSAELTA
jgi:magnesium chelatase family protein